jgi:hypothetical protein
MRVRVLAAGGVIVAAAFADVDRRGHDGRGAMNDA